MKGIDVGYSKGKAYSNTRGITETATATTLYQSYSK